MKILLCIVLALLFISGCNTDNYVPFKPVYKEGDVLVPSNEDMSMEFKENMKFVLDNHKEPYRENAVGEILIPKKVWEDQDLMWNYTTKANDPEWLNSRPIMP